MTELRNDFGQTGYEAIGKQKGITGHFTLIFLTSKLVHLCDATSSTASTLASDNTAVVVLCPCL